MTFGFLFSVLVLFPLLFYFIVFLLPACMLVFFLCTIVLVCFNNIECVFLYIQDSNIAEFSSATRLYMY